MVAAFCGGALSGCGAPAPTPTPAPTTAPAPTTPAPAPPSIKPAWDNHVAAFGEGIKSKKVTDERKDALDKIMKDYDGNSIVSIWDAAKTDAQNCKGGTIEKCTPQVEHKGLVSIRDMFDGLFTALDGCLEDGISDGLGTKHELVEAAGSAPGSVFLVWECPKAKYIKATDTFVFDGVMIRKQNIVVETTSSVVSHGIPTPVSFGQGILAQDEYKPTDVKTAWKNHFDAFSMGAGLKDGDDDTAALNMIMKDYIEDSVVHIASYPEGTDSGIPTFEPHKGIVAIRKMFKDLFASIGETCDLAAPLVEVTGDTGTISDAKQVFLVWRIPASKYKWATDTFVFDDNFKITKQNIVAVQAAATTCSFESVVV